MIETDAARRPSTSTLFTSLCSLPASRTSRCGLRVEFDVLGLGWPLLLPMGFLSSVCRRDLSCAISASYLRTPGESCLLNHSDTTEACKTVWEFEHMGRQTLAQGLRY
jgi:hypothetical protein